MEIRLAEKKDLPQLKAMYHEIIDYMNRSGIRIWDESYPCGFFQEDIKRENLYLLTGKQDILSAFVLCESNDGEGCLNWKSRKEKALYIARFGVNVHYMRTGMGRLALTSSVKLAKERNAEALRLLVVDCNQPAVNLYLKYGFQRVEGIYEEKIDEGFTLREYGFELQFT